jgi:hypothetical protein
MIFVCHEESVVGLDNPISLIDNRDKHFHVVYLFRPCCESAQGWNLPKANNQKV